MNKNTNKNTNGNTNITNQDLAKLAIEARSRAYTPYSNFMVGAALLTKGGKVYQGCNIENAGYSPTVCAERTAFFKAVYEGEREFTAIAVAGWPRDAKSASAAFPCGVCRQVMREFCDPKSFKILVLKGNTGEYTEHTEYTEYTEHTLEELLPYGFGPSDLGF